MIASEVEAHKDPQGVALMDAKALLDSLNSDQSQGGADDRASLEVVIIKDLQKCRDAMWNHSCGC